jgi:hypothetical protein
VDVGEGRLIFSAFLSTLISLSKCGNEEILLRKWQTTVRYNIEYRLVILADDTNSECAGGMRVDMDQDLVEKGRILSMLEEPVGECKIKH